MVLILMCVMKGITMSNELDGDDNFDREAHEEHNRYCVCVILMLILITAICLQVSILSDCVPRADNEGDTMFYLIGLPVRATMMLVMVTMVIICILVADYHCIVMAGNS